MSSNLQFLNSISLKKKHIRDVRDINKEIEQVKINHDPEYLSQIHNDDQDLNEAPLEFQKFNKIQMKSSNLAKFKKSLDQSNVGLADIISMNKYQLLDLYNYFDCDGSQSLDRNEMKTLGEKIGLSHDEIDEIFNTIDVNNDGDISVDEWLSYFEKRKNPQINTQISNEYKKEKAVDNVKLNRSIDYQELARIQNEKNKIDQIVRTKTGNHKSNKEGSEDEVKKVMNDEYFDSSLNELNEKEQFSVKDEVSNYNKLINKINAGIVNEENNLNDEFDELDKFFQDKNYQVNHGRRDSTTYSMIINDNDNFGFNKKSMKSPQKSSFNYKRMESGLINSKIRTGFNSPTSISNKRNRFSLIAQSIF